MHFYEKALTVKIRKFMQTIAFQNFHLHQKNIQLAR
jgi:hypothetical protein